jgi:hypothetical protein
MLMRKSTCTSALFIVTIPEEAYKTILLLLLVIIIIIPRLSLLNQR